MKRVYEILRYSRKDLQDACIFNHDFKLDIVMALSGDIALGYWYVIGKMVGAPWDGGPLIINPIYTLYSGYLSGISPFKGLQQGGLNS